MPVLSLVVAFMNISLLGHLMCLVACAFGNHILSVWRVLLRIQRCNFNLWIIFLCLVLQELFFKYSWNNFLHTQVEKCITTVLNNPPTEEDGEQCTPLVDVVSLLVILANFCSCEVYLVASLRPIYTVRFLLTIVACDFCSARCSRHEKIVYDFQDIKLPAATIVVGF